MAIASKRAKITVDLRDPALVRAIRHAAVERSRPMQSIVAEALRKWLDGLEDEEDAAVLRARRGGPVVPWEQVKAEIRELESRGE
ncbi:MAG: hypothetical protein HYX92_16475 [Chloroflexi bacterium]|nr:hypothetical protein [Chloroflexota bacterium]